MDKDELEQLADLLVRYLEVYNMAEQPDLYRGVGMVIDDVLDMLKEETYQRTRGKLKAGDKILVEQAWENEIGGYRDEYAEVVAIAEDGTLRLTFLNVSPEVQDYLQQQEYNAQDYED